MFGRRHRFEKIIEVRRGKRRNLEGGDGDGDGGGGVEGGGGEENAGREKE